MHVQMTASARESKEEKTRVDHAYYFSHVSCMLELADFICEVSSQPIKKAVSLGYSPHRVDRLSKTSFDIEPFLKLPNRPHLSQHSQNF